MIKTVKISNFKSVQDLELELGRLNVFIGENGCGKTSILEGIAMGSAAAQSKLDNEFLVSRGIRCTEPRLMKSAFSTENQKSSIIFGASNKANQIMDIIINAKSDSINDWGGVSITVSDENSVDPDIPKANINDSSKEMMNSINGYGENIHSAGVPQDKTDKVHSLVEQEIRDLIASNEVKMPITEPPQDKIDQVLSLIEKAINNLLKKNLIKIEGTVWKSFLESTKIQDFLLYAPENYFLRRFEEEGQIRPLGIRGEGLFSHLVELSKEAPETFAAIADNLSLIDWYGGFAIPNDLQFTERRIAITDRFISDTIKNFDQRSANEGFLYLLFYFTLFLSKSTPKFFAIDNVDNALNPRLCAKLVEIMARLAKEQDKQAILTTHNPAILDGLDLTDDEQRLFVIYRNADGATQARRVKPLQVLPGVEPVRLSEAFVRGYLGGLPKNF